MSPNAERLTEIAAELRRLASSSDDSCDAPRLIAQTPAYVGGILLREAISAGGLSEVKHVILRDFVLGDSAPQPEQVIGGIRFSREIASDVLFVNVVHFIHRVIDPTVVTIADALVFLADAIVPKAPSGPRSKRSFKSKRGRKRMIERNREWLKEFENSGYTVAYFAEQKGICHSAMSRALDAARKDRDKPVN